MNPAISAIQQIIGSHPLSIVSILEGDPLLALMPYDQNTSKYILDDSGHVTGLNISNIDLSDAKWEAVLAVLDPAYLQALNLSDNQLTTFHLSAAFRALKGLNLSDNLGLAHFHVASAIPTLLHLDISACTLARLHLPAGFVSLQKLSAPHNEITTAVLDGAYPQLTHLDLGNNQLTGFVCPQGTKNLQYLNLRKNPAIASPPIEIVEQGSAAVLNWYAATKKQLKEIKILVVGDAEAGKTSLLRRLKDNTFNEKEPQTDGVIIEPFPFGEMSTFTNQKDLHDVKAYFWDFGGQDIMRSTHQFFMTNRSVYLLLLEARNDIDPDKQVRKWLQQITRQGGNSPVLIVINKIEVNRSFGVDTEKLKLEFPQIKAAVSISCKEGENGEGIDLLRDLLQTWIPSAELFHTEVDERWISIKDDLQKLTEKEPCIPEKDFKRICADHGLLNPEEQSQAITFLNDLGILLHYKNLPLKEYFVLEPYWVTYGVYRIITSPMAAKNQGRVALSDLDFIVNEETRQEGQYRSSKQRTDHYSPNELRYLAEIMDLFKLSFHTSEKDAILIPDLMDYKTPVDRVKPFRDDPHSLHLIYDYGKDLPAHTFTRLMVELHQEIEFPWRSGIIFDCQSNIVARALVEKNENKISITVSGDHRHKRDYLTIIRYHLDRINQEQKGNALILVPLPGYPGQAVSLEKLIRMEKSGETQYTHFDIEEAPTFDIRRDLLDGIDTKEEVEQRASTIIHHHHYSSQPREDPPPTLKKIMFLLSSPDGSNPLNFSTELKRIQDARTSSEHHSAFEKPMIEPGIVAAKFTKTVLAQRPHILHLTMHASRSLGLFFEDKNQQRQAVSAEKLRAYFEIFSEDEYRPEICILSACNSIEHARAIQPYCDCVIGTQDFFPDEAACLYAEVFYEHLFNSSKVSTAHKAACQTLQESGLTFDDQLYPIHEIPVLLT